MGGAVVAAALGVGAMLVLTSTDDGEEAGPEVELDPRADEFPEATARVADETLAFLDGEGAPLLQVHRAAMDLPEDPTPAACRQVVRQLDAEAPSGQVIDLAVQLPDEVLTEAVLAERSALGRTLTSCVEGAPRHRRELRDVAALVSARLVQLEAAAG